MLEKKTPYEISKPNLKTGARKCLLGALELSGYAKDMVERGANTTIALGLYSFAIEEYGKYLIFSELLKKDSERYLVPKEVFFGKKSPDLKFKKAISDLPLDCYSVRSAQTHLSKNRMNETNVNNMTKTPTHTELFSAEGFTADFETRMSCFYLDWNDDKKRWNQISHIANDDLLKAITVFEEVLSKKLDLEYDSKSSH